MQESQQIATEHHNLAVHAHRTGAEQHGKEDHLTGHESSRLALEHSNKAYLLAQDPHQYTRNPEGVESAAHQAKHQEALEVFAYRLWQGRGCPQGSPHQDWFRAVEALRSRTEPE